MSENLFNNDSIKSNYLSARTTCRSLNISNVTTHDIHQPEPYQRLPGDT